MLLCHFGGGLARLYVSVVVAFEGAELGVELLILAQVGVDAGEAVADHLVGVQVRVDVELVVLHGAEEARADKAGVEAGGLDALLKVGLVVVVVCGGVEGVVGLLEALGAAALAVVDLGVDVHGAEGRDADVGGEVVRVVPDALSEAEGGVLGGGVGGLDAHAGLQAADGAGEQEVGLGALLLHDGHDLGGVVGHGEEVDGGDPVPILGRDVAESAGAADARVAEEDVDLAELVHDALDAQADLLVLGDVDLDGDGLGGTGGLALLPDILDTVVDIDEGETHALFRRVERKSLADAAGRSGDAANLARIVFHVLASFPKVVFPDVC